jgi:energy-coupling factor transporter ATP-binding protein EcfA2
MSADPLYELEDLEIAYGSQIAFAIPRLAIAQGERVALIGPNGSGKTTLLKALNGLVRPSAGSLRFLGRDLAASGEMRRRSVYLHQHPYLLAGTVAYNVSFGCRARGLRRQEADRRALEAMAMLGLEPLSRRRHRALSGGETQRVALARALAAGADVLLIDEPTASADSDSRELIAAALGRSAEAGATILFATHDPALVRRLATRTLVFDRGRVTRDFTERRHE